MPVFWFALSQAETIHWPGGLLIFAVLHLLVYPSSNGYNSYMDQDTGSIGGIERPLPAARPLLYVSVVMDLIACALGGLLSMKVLLGIAAYITASRLYSYRGIRLKKYPIVGYLTVVICQGALVYYIVSWSIQPISSAEAFFFPAILSSLLIGGTYPLTQVYQHRQDLEDGVKTLSYKLGVSGTFIFCALLLFVALLLLIIYFMQTGRPASIGVYAAATLPVGVYLVRWFLKVKRDVRHANYKHLMTMNWLASVCSSAAFIVILIINKL